MYLFIVFGGFHMCVDGPHARRGILGWSLWAHTAAQE